MEHPLALAVYNDGPTYKSRVARHSTISRDQYIKYLRGLVVAQAHKERTEFGTPMPDSQNIEQATKELLEGMDGHITESNALRDYDAEGVKAIIFLQGVFGVLESPEDASAGWLAMTMDQRDHTMSLYHALSKAAPKESGNV